MYTVFNEKKREKSFPVFKNIINIRKKTDAYAGIKPAATKTKKNGKTPLYNPLTHLLFYGNIIYSVYTIYYIKKQGGCQW